MKPGGPRRSAILAAAATLLLRLGVRATSMEAIARAAGVAKPTLYAYFADKEAVLLALAEVEIGTHRREMLSVLGGDGDPAQRAAAALTARCKQTMRHRASPHADELYSAESRVAGRLVGDLEAELMGRLEHELAEAGVQRARLLAQLLLAASAGIADRAVSPAELGPALRLLCERLIRPELPA